MSTISKEIQNEQRQIDVDEEGAKKANELVRHIVGAVSILGRAVNEGGTEGLSNELRNQKNGFVRCVVCSCAQWV